jgi:hypothetical protein
MFGGTLTGVHGRIDYGYFPAATLEGFTVTRRSPTAFVLRGTCIDANAFNLRQRPLVFVVPTQSGEWRWPVETVTVANGRLAAQLGAPLPMRTPHV